MTDCLDCGQKLKDNRIGLINFGDPDHYRECPERNFPHCPNCGTDLSDLDNHHYYIGKKKVKDHWQKVIDDMFPAAKGKPPVQMWPPTDKNPFDEI